MTSLIRLLDAEYFYYDCELILQLYKSGACIAIYGEAKTSDGYCCKVGKTIMKDDSIIEVDRLEFFINGSGITWQEARYKMAEFIKDADCFIEYDDFSNITKFKDSFDTFPKIIFDIRAIVADSITRFANVYGINVRDIMASINFMKYGEDTESVDYYDETFFIIKRMLEKYKNVKSIIGRDEDNIVPEIRSIRYEIIDDEGLICVDTNYFTMYVTDRGWYVSRYKLYAHEMNLLELRKAIFEKCGVESDEELIKHFKGNTFIM